MLTYSTQYYTLNIHTRYTKHVPRLQGTLVTPKGLLDGSITFGNTIESIETSSQKQNQFILPGFIDTHVHGGNSGDTMDGADGVLKLARFHLSHGTTTLYPTTMTNPWGKIIKALQGIKEVLKEKPHGLPDIPGAHLEGPFINPQRLGAQPPFTLEPTQEHLDELLAFDIIRLVTLAPEIKGGLEAARIFAKNTIRVSAGHTAATYEQINAMLETVRKADGIAGFTHLYNAMGGLTGREPNVVGAALANQESFAELIFDLHHVHPGSFLAALRAKLNYLFFITDCIRAAGLPEGESELGGQKVIVKNGKATLESGNLAGSVLTMDQAFRNALELGLDLTQISKLLSSTPARYMGLDDRGVLETGKRADLVVLNKDFKIQDVYVAGQKVIG
jgi:N-acetylglucosamine-6-phosphate deacetylase